MLLDLVFILDGVLDGGVIFFGGVVMFLFFKFLFEGLLLVGIWVFDGVLVKEKFIWWVLYCNRS